MTKRNDLLRKIGDAAKAAGLTWEVEREGGNHTIYKLGGEEDPDRSARRTRQSLR
ncbi:hypothetical protein [Nocardia mangyaensis]|uniref:hypothetical protein n=1 Tax=Nocardia mangyaensis TaxID=2213200 RepID=UPI001F0A6B66|nr:hypothetical protein [Nocardia mangyaensis]